MRKYVNIWENRVLGQVNVLENYVNNHANYLSPKKYKKVNKYIAKIKKEIIGGNKL